MSRISSWFRSFAGSTDSKSAMSREARVALFIHGCFQIGASMSALFLNLFLWRLTEDLRINALFNVVVYGMTPVAFAFGGWMAKKYDRMVVYRLGIALCALFFLSVIFSGSWVAGYYPLFGLFYGTALGFYWVGYLVLMYDVTDIAGRGKFLATNTIVFNAAGLIGPALSGYIVVLFEGLSGYFVTFGIACFLFAVASLTSMQIRKIQSAHRKYYVNYSFQMMKRDTGWVRGLFSFFFLGLFQGMMLFLPNLLLFRTVGREDWVGYLTVFFSLLVIITGLVLRRSNRNRIRRDLMVSIACVIAASTLLLIEVSAWSVICYMAIYSLFNPVTLNTLNFHYYRLMDRLPLKGHFRIESVVMREFFINAGRVASILLLIVFATSLESPLLPVVLVVFGILQVAIIILVGNDEAGASTPWRRGVKPKAVSRQ